MRHRVLHLLGQFLAHFLLLFLKTEIKDQRIEITIKTAREFAYVLSGAVGYDNQYLRLAAAAAAAATVVGGSGD
uniref:Uncharacterized protein LOC105647198 isoform X3 n=1 Tax=Rhizophora mucronata TaxID=61149 RepID=A0A2P2KD34_RHIMU